MSKEKEDLIENLKEAKKEVKTLKKDIKDWLSK